MRTSMHTRQVICLMTIMGLTAAAAADPTVTLTLDSSRSGLIVPPGSAIDWTIAAGVSTGDNYGLAAVCCDLVQDPNNPAALDLPPADPNSIDATMQQFDRPDGITNPGEGGAASGYIGVQRGAIGEMNLIQIGGGQNTFGQALPLGTDIAESADIVASIGQAAPQTVVSGAFDAPVTVGVYTLSLTNAIANVITELNAPPAYSPVANATVDVAAATFSFTITLIGDLDLDCDVDLSDLSQLLANYGTTSGMTWSDGDLDGDGDVDLSDLSALLSNYGESCP